MILWALSALMGVLGLHLAALALLAPQLAYAFWYKNRFWPSGWYEDSAIFWKTFAKYPREVDLTKAPIEHSWGEMTRQKVLVIGAGPVGLGFAATLRRKGVWYDQVDAGDGVGGNWNGGVYKNVHIISSKLSTEYKDYPMPDNYPDFPSAAQLLKYYNDYTDHYQLRPQIKFKTRVKSVIPANGEGDDREKWLVIMEDVEGGKVTELVYETLLICNGHHFQRRIPQYPGKFTGEVLHSKEYKSPAQLEGKKVLVIGGGNSGVDVAFDASRVGAESHLSLRRGYHFLPRSILGKPIVDLYTPLIPSGLTEKIVSLLLRIVNGPMGRYNLKEPTHSLFQKHPTVTSDLLPAILKGSITPHGDVARFSGSSVQFTDGSSAEIDNVVYATGYHLSLPMLSEEVLPRQDGDIPYLISSTTHPFLRGLFVIGLRQVRFGVGPAVSAGADTILDMIRCQKSLQYPIGAVMQAMGRKPMKKISGTEWQNDFLSDPFRDLKGYLKSRWFMPMMIEYERGNLKKVEKVLRKWADDGYEVRSL